ncbi:hypothetical protein ACWFNE_20275 [Cellulomonas sp. NPDC055163]
MEAAGGSIGAADPDTALCRVMTDYARRVLREDARTYDLCLDACGILTDTDLVVDATHGGAAYCLWGEASDLYDDPRRPDFGDTGRTRQLEEHARRFARDWLDLDPADRRAVAEFFERWASR